MERKDWNRIGLAAAVVLLPGGFLLGAVLAARRMRAAAEGPALADASPPTDGDASHSDGGVMASRRVEAILPT